MAWRTILDHRDREPASDVRNTMAAAGLTLLDCTRILADGALGELDEDQVETRVHTWAHHMFEVSHAAIEVHGEEHIPDGRCVLLSNHTSLMDPPAMVLAFPRRLSFVAKQELRAIPVFGSAMDRFGVVFVDRRRPRKAVAQLAAARDHLPRDRAIWIAVEGGRSRDGALRRFKKGPFHLALQWQVPIVPTYIVGAREMLPADAWSLTTGQRLRVAYAPPIPTAGAGATDLRRLMDETRSAIEELRDVCAGRRAGWRRVGPDEEGGVLSRGRRLTARGGRGQGEPLGA